MAIYDGLTNRKVESRSGATPDWARNSRPQITWGLEFPAQSGGAPDRDSTFRLVRELEDRAALRKMIRPDRRGSPTRPSNPGLNWQNIPGPKEIHISAKSTTNRLLLPNNTLENLTDLHWKISDFSNPNLSHGHPGHYKATHFRSTRGFKAGNVPESPH
jgi:hypothetical protein